MPIFLNASIDFDEDTSYVKKIYFMNKLIFDNGKIIDKRLYFKSNKHSKDSHLNKRDTFHICYKGIQFKVISINCEGINITISRDGLFSKHYRVGIDYLGTSLSGLIPVLRRKKHC